MEALSEHLGVSLRHVELEPAAVDSSHAAIRATAVGGAHATECRAHPGRRAVQLSRRRRMRAGILKGLAPTDRAGEAQFFGYGTAVSTPVGGKRHAGEAVPEVRSKTEPER